MNVDDNVVAPLIFTIFKLVVPLTDKFVNVIVPVTVKLSVVKPPVINTPFVNDDDLFTIKLLDIVVIAPDEEEPIVKFVALLNKDIVVPLQFTLVPVIIKLFVLKVPLDTTKPFEKFAVPDTDNVVGTVKLFTVKFV